MSFSRQVKAELAALPRGREHCMQAELCGIVLLAGSLTLGTGGMSLLISTEHEGVVRRAMGLLRHLYDIEAELSQKDSLKKNETLVLRVVGRADSVRVMEGAGLSMLRISPERLSELTGRECCRDAFLRGCFLGGGSISDPNKDYHLEFVAGMQESALAIQNILSNTEIHGRIADRKDGAVVYMKGFEDITTLFTRIGAHGALLEMENIRILKDIRNNVNRQINCESANLQKQVRTSMRQTKELSALKGHKALWDRLTPTLKETAVLRLENPQATLSELAALAGVSRSGLNHRLKKLSEIAAGLAETQEE